MTPGYYILVTASAKGRLKTDFLCTWNLSIVAINIYIFLLLQLGKEHEHVFCKFSLKHGKGGISYYKTTLSCRE